MVSKVQSQANISNGLLAELEIEHPMSCCISNFSYGINIGFCMLINNAQRKGHLRAGMKGRENAIVGKYAINAMLQKPAYGNPKNIINNRGD